MMEVVGRMQLSGGVGGRKCSFFSFGLLKQRSVKPPTLNAFFSLGTQWVLSDSSAQQLARRVRGLYCPNGGHGAGACAFFSAGTTKHFLDLSRRQSQWCCVCSDHVRHSSECVGPEVVHISLMAIKTLKYLNSI